VSGTRITVQAGPHSRASCPVSLELGEGAPCGRIVDPSDPEAELFSQTDAGRLHFIVPRLRAGATKQLELVTGEECTCDGRGVQVEPLDGRVEITINSRPFVIYNHGPDLVRPFFHPVVGPYGTEMTRAWPVVEGVAGEETDHVHHKSFWVAHGLVNGSDHWSENEARLCRQVHEEFERTWSGCVQGGFTERVRWQTTEGTRILTERRTLRVWNTPRSLRLADLEVEFTATDGDVLFGDTKEGGICSIRIAEAIKGARGGRIENAQGGVGEAECWGKRSPWVDYSGKFGRKVAGIAMMDHPLNPRHPTFWHVRDYGLFSANPFGLSHFKSSYDTCGDWTLPADATATFRYRLAFHKSDARKGKVGARYNDWINPPEVTVEG